MALKLSRFAIATVLALVILLLSMAADLQKISTAAVTTSPEINEFVSLRTDINEEVIPDIEEDELEVLEAVDKLDEKLSDASRARNDRDAITETSNAKFRTLDLRQKLTDLKEHTDELENKINRMAELGPKLQISANEKRIVNANLDKTKVILDNLTGKVDSAILSMEDGDEGENASNTSTFDDINDWLDHAIVLFGIGSTSNGKSAIRSAERIFDPIKDFLEDDKEDLLGNITENMELIGFCGDNTVNLKEDCDGVSDSACPGFCSDFCQCPHPTSRALTEPSRISIFYDNISVNEITTANIEPENTALLNVSFVFKAFISNIRIFIDTNITTAGTTTQGVYQYFRIFFESPIHTNALSYAEINFRVQNSWLAQNNISSIELQNFANKRWAPLPTAEIGRDNRYAYYVSAQVSPISLGEYAIVGKLPPAPPTPRVIELPPVCGNKKVEAGETQENCCVDTGCPVELSCISNRCQEVSRCGNNICEAAEDAQVCPSDCARVLFGTAGLVLILLLMIGTIISLYLFYKSYTKRKKPIPRRRHATPEQWF